MNIDLIARGQQLLTFDRMLILVVIGLMTIVIDGRHMKRIGLDRESLWAKIIGGVLILGSIGAWTAFKILG